MRFRSLVLLPLIAQTAAAQAPDAAGAVRGATVSGIVHDSLAGTPLVGATVQLAGSDTLINFVRMATSDALGRFTLRDIPAGRFILGFFHPMLDSLGIEAPARKVTVEGLAPVRADLAIPSAPRLHAAICGPRPPDSTAVIVGSVRDASTGMPMPGATVMAEWLELSLSSAGVRRRVPRVTATTGLTGWFALCGVPGDAVVFLSSSRGADSTGQIEVQVPLAGLLRQELFLGSSRGQPAGASAIVAAVDSVRAPTAQVGTGRLTGTVVAAGGGQPLAAARVGIAGGPSTATDERGEWVLENAPLGTRMLEVRAVGYMPVRHRVDVVAGAAPINVSLAALGTVLDTVTVTATRLNSPHSGFDERRRTSGAGRYFTAADVERRQPLVTSDLLETIPGVYVERTESGKTELTMRGAFASRCDPAVYIDGHHMRGLDADDVDNWVTPEELGGMEVYASGMTPPQFDPGMSGCGSIVIWTKPPAPSPPGRPLIQRILRMLGVAAVAVAVGSLLY